MKLIELIRPYFGAISICETFVGDSRKEGVLDEYDKDGWTRMDANYSLYAKLSLQDPGFDNGFVRLDSYANDNIAEIILDVVFGNAEVMHQFNRIIFDYFSRSDLFDDCSHDERCWTFRNGINEIHGEVSDHELILEVYPPSASGIEPGRNYEAAILRTVSGLVRDERDEWDDYLWEVRSDYQC